MQEMHAQNTILGEQRFQMSEDPAVRFHHHPKCEGG